MELSASHGPAADAHAQGCLVDDGPVWGGGCPVQHALPFHAERDAMLDRGTTSRGKTHWMGWKLDVSPTTCVNKYVTSRFKYVGTRSDGAKLYKSPAGNMYARESNHWDILFNAAAA
ncbi:hypothetical protein GCM10017771_05550 [Streptomyces capitiformicae]|uniref:Uncharacterized protein n=2 Tax=Streptomyces capitiformicae TaxID=2014920 RepID=A0A919GCP5_9ACTN|nr:hypothetical protein GCM10017771_05550 [Streptomyces capitiformicae]